MRSKCRLQDNQPASGSVQQEENAQQSGSLSTTDASIALAAARASTSALRERLAAQRWRPGTPRLSLPLC
jgi:hypothetical protein